ncbi:hypothetical protein ACP4OV_024539 [Aristida adscensionis]
MHVLGGMVKPEPESRPPPPPPANIGHGGGGGGGVSSRLLPAFGEPSPPLRGNVINPFRCRYRWWQAFLIALVVYSAWASPFELALERAAAAAPLLVVDLVVDAFFAVDIAVSFCVAYVDKSTNLIVDDRRKIAARYLARPWFTMDVASTIPFQIIYHLMSRRSAGMSLFRCLSLLRLWRLRRVNKLFASTGEGHQVQLLLDQAREAPLRDSVLAAFGGVHLLVDGVPLQGQGAHVAGPSPRSPPSATATCTR